MKEWIDASRRRQPNDNEKKRTQTEKQQQQKENKGKTELETEDEEGMNKWIDWPERNNRKRVDSSGRNKTRPKTKTQKDKQIKTQEHKEHK